MTTPIVGLLCKLELVEIGGVYVSFCRSLVSVDAYTTEDSCSRIRIPNDPCNCLGYKFDLLAYLLFQQPTEEIFFESRLIVGTFSVR